MKKSKSKTEFVLSRKHSDLKKIENLLIEIKAAKTAPSQPSKGLEIIFDQTVSMTDQLSALKKFFF